MMQLLIKLSLSIIRHLGNLNRFLVFRSFGVLPPKDLSISLLSNLLTMIVPDEGYSRKKSCTFDLIFGV